MNNHEDPLENERPKSIFFLGMRNWMPDSSSRLLSDNVLCYRKNINRTVKRVELL